MGILKFNEFDTKSIQEADMTTTEKMQKSEDLTGKINDLKKSREEALKKNDKEKVSILEIKIDIAECDKKKWELQKKLMQLQK